jgi:hypothetical protein
MGLFKFTIEVQMADTVADKLDTMNHYIMMFFFLQKFPILKCTTDFKTTLHSSYRW